MFCSSLLYFDGDGLLSLLFVFAVSVDLEPAEAGFADLVLGEHALDSATNQLVSTVGLSQDVSGSLAALTTRITSIAGVNLICLLLTCEDYLVGIDNDYVVTTVNVRCEVWFVLSANQLGYF